MTAIAELVPVNENDVGGESIQTVNARDLHLWLESRQDFSTWIKKRIDQYGFTENEDFSVNLVAYKYNSKRGGHNQLDYFISLDMAKTIAAAERNNKGKAILAHLSANSVMTDDELFELISDVDVDHPLPLYTYIIKEVETGKLKLGISTNPAARIKTLQVGNPNTLELVSIRHAPNGLADEKAMHNANAPYHIRGEWFRPEALELTAVYN